MIDLADAFRLAVRNIARWGDTDVFPFAPENHVFHDRTDELVDVPLTMHSDLDAALVETPALVEGALSLITYEGFRWVTQIDPVSNAYFLGLLLHVGPELEASRLEAAILSR